MGGSLHARTNAVPTEWIRTRTLSLQRRWSGIGTGNCALRTSNACWSVSCHRRSVPSIRGGPSEPALIKRPDRPDPALPSTPAEQHQIGNSTADEVKNDLNDDQPHHSRDGKQGRQTRSDHRGPSINPYFPRQILRTPHSDTHLDGSNPKHPPGGSDPDQLVKTARRKLNNRQDRKAARECLMKIHSARTNISVAITTART